MSTLERAIEIATEAHKGQFDKAGNDYIHHPLRVMAAGKSTEEKIVGVADGFIRKGRRVMTDGPKWRIYSSVWQILKPFRRILLAIFRRI
jgi:hypothetical protein